MTQEKIWFWDIVKTMEPRWVMSSMATWAVGMLTMIVGTKLNFMFLKYFAWILSILAIIFFILFVIIFSLRIFKYPGEVKKDLSHPIAANFFAWIFISAAVIVTIIWNVLNPLGWVALVFPVAAFWIWLKFLSIDLSCAWLCPVVWFIWLLAISLWFIVFTKTLKAIYTKKAFQRPKVVK